jgi:hypothetical protein
MATERTIRDDAAGLAPDRPLTDAEILAQIPAARQRAEDERRHGFRADSVRYSQAQEQIKVTLTTGAEIGIPVAILPALRNTSPRDLAGVEVTPSGAALRWERLDVDLSVPAIIREALGEQAVSSLFAAAGGRATSAAKAGAARENGKKGGRPPGTGRKAATAHLERQGFRKKATPKSTPWFTDARQRAATAPAFTRVAAKKAGKVAAKRAGKVVMKKVPVIAHATVTKPKPSP